MCTNQHCVGGNNILDLILTSHFEMVENLHVAEHLGNSDHTILTWNLVVAVKKICKKSSRRQYHKGNYIKMRDWFGDIKWTSIFSKLSINEKWTFFCEKITEATNLFIPEGTERNIKSPKWLNRKTKIAQNHKEKMWKRYKESHSNTDYILYKKALNEATKQYKKAKKCFERK